MHPTDVPEVVEVAGGRPGDAVRVAGQGQGDRPGAGQDDPSPQHRSPPALPRHRGGQGHRERTHPHGRKDGGVQHGMHVAGERGGRQEHPLPMLDEPSSPHERCSGQRAPGQKRRGRPPPPASRLVRRRRSGEPRGRVDALDRAHGVDSPAASTRRPTRRRTRTMATIAAPHTTASAANSPAVSFLGSSVWLSRRPPTPSNTGSDYRHSVAETTMATWMAARPRVTFRRRATPTRSTTGAITRSCTSAPPRNHTPKLAGWVPPGCATTPQTANPIAAHPNAPRTQKATPWWLDPTLAFERAPASGTAAPEFT